MELAGEVVEGGVKSGRGVCSGYLLPGAGGCEERQMAC